MPRTVPAGLGAHIDNGGTSLCNLLNITDVLGNTLALTDNPENLTVSSVTYLARPGAQISVMKTNGQMEYDNYEVMGYFVEGVVTLADVLKGRFTGARVRRYLVNYDSVSDGVLQIGDGNVSRMQVTDNAFKAQVIGKMWRLSQPVGRVTTRRCDVTRLGDERCQFNLATTQSGTGNPFQQTLTVTSVTNAITFNVSGASTSDPVGYDVSDFFENGDVLWLTGNNTGYRHQVAMQEFVSGLRLTLQTQPGADIQVGDTMTATAGCNRTTLDCRRKFVNSSQPNGNLVNFRGQPGLVGNDIYLTADKIKNIDDAGGRT